MPPGDPARWGAPPRGRGGRGGRVPGAGGSPGALTSRRAGGAEGGGEGDPGGSEGAAHPQVPLGLREVVWDSSSSPLVVGTPAASPGVPAGPPSQRAREAVSQQGSTLIWALTSLLLTDRWLSSRNLREPPPPPASSSTAAGRSCELSFCLVRFDNFYGGGLGSVNDAAFTETLPDVSSSRALQVPWHAVLGNVDSGDWLVGCQPPSQDSRCGGEAVL